MDRPGKPDRLALVCTSSNILHIRAGNVDILKLLYFRVRSLLLKPLYWMGATLKDLRRSPEGVKDGVGFALELAQRGQKALNAKPLKGFRGAGVLEIVEDYGGDTWRAVYTVEIADAVFVLHFFQKKSKKGIATPQHHLDLIKRRLREARAFASQEQQ